MNFDGRIEELFIDLPEPPIEKGGVANAVQAGKFVFIGGVLPWKEGKLAFSGRLGLELNLDAGQRAAHSACINALSMLNAHLGGSLNKVKKIALLRGFIASGAEFKDQHKVLDGASKLLNDIFGNAGKHARSAIGVNTLPFGAAVELELIVEIK